MNKNFGQIIGRFFLTQDLGIKNDYNYDIVTLSEIMETFPHWKDFVLKIKSQNIKNVYLFTMFETSDVHPDIITAMKHFDKVIVPFRFQSEILCSHGVNCEALNYYSSDLINKKPKYIKKIVDYENLVFLFVGKNEERKNIKSLIKVFSEVLKDTNHKLTIKTDKMDGLNVGNNIEIVTDKYDIKDLSDLYNSCDIFVSFTHGEGVGMPILEANYFNKPIISHNQGVFKDLKKLIRSKWFELDADEVQITGDIPPYLEKVFYKSWWKVNEQKAITKIKSILDNIRNYI